MENGGGVFVTGTGVSLNCIRQSVNRRRHSRAAQTNSSCSVLEYWTKISTSDRVRPFCPDAGTRREIRCFCEKEFDYGETAGVVCGSDSFYRRPFYGRTRCGEERNVVRNRNE